MADNDTSTTTDDQTTGNDTAPAAGGNDTPPADPATALEKGGKGDTPPPAATDFPEDWRSRMAGEDAKFAKQLERYTDPAAVGKAMREAQAKISEGFKAPDAPKAPGEDASDADKAAYEKDIAAYRELTGVPAEAGGYADALEGVVVGDDDKDLVDGFFAVAHEANLPPLAVQVGVNYIMAQQEALVEAQAATDAENQSNTVEALREEWGPDYKVNSQSALNYLSATAGEELAENMMNSRMPDGTRWGDSLEVMKYVAAQSRAANPAGFVAPSEGGSQAQSVDDEIEGIKKYMKEKPQEYFKDEKTQARYRELLTAQEKFKSQAA